jgi:hypothetical protein
MPLPALLMAQGMIPRQDVPVGTSEGPRINERKRTREDALPSPSTKRHEGPAIKKEAMSGAARAQRIRELQVSRASNVLLHWSLLTVVRAG